MFLNSTHLNAQHVNGMTPFNLAVYRGKLVDMHVRLLDTL